MEIIRSKRATSSTGTTPGQPKSKYRKRSVRVMPFKFSGSSDLTYSFSSEPRPLVNATPATSERLRSGDVGRTAQERCVTRVVCVSNSKRVAIPLLTSHVIRQTMRS